MLFLITHINILHSNFLKKILHNIMYTVWQIIELWKNDFNYSGKERILILANFNTPGLSVNS